jgi:hypothetical protein
MNSKKQTWMADLSAADSKETFEKSLVQAEEELKALRVEISIAQAKIKKIYNKYDFDLNTNLDIVTEKCIPSSHRR